MWRQDHNRQHVNHNSLVDLSHATMVLQKAAEWSERLGVDVTKRPRWAAVLAGLPGLPTTSDGRSLSHGPAGVPLSNSTGARRVWSESSYVNSKNILAVAPFATNYEYPIVHFAAVHPCGLLGLHSNALRGPAEQEELLDTAINTIWGDNDRTSWHPINGLCLSWPAATRVTNGSAPGRGRSLLDRYESALNATMHLNFWPDIWAVVDSSKPGLPLPSMNCCCRATRASSSCSRPGNAVTPRRRSRHCERVGRFW